MVIDSLKYNGKCSCGKEHKMATEFCIIEGGCLKDISTYMEKYNLTGFTVAVYDENTYNATADRHPAADLEIILKPENLHADERGVELLLKQLPDNTEALIAVGSGTIHDIVRYCAYTKDIDFVSCPTAASVDGFCSSVAAMTWQGCKKTLTAVAPKIVVADIDIISKAPKKLTNSGFGDMIGKFIALADWRIANALTGEYFCPEIYNISLDATRAVVDNAKAIKNGDADAYGKLIYGLLMSGIAMQLLGNSRCASGAEHHISHLIEMQPVGLAVNSDALHGEKVGVGTLLAASEYHKLKNSRLRWGSFTEYDDFYVRKMFGDRLSDSIIEENRNNCISMISSSIMEEKWGEICGIIDDIPTYDELIRHYRLLGAKGSLEEIGVPEERLNVLLEYSPLVRNRLTLMRLRRLIEG